MPGGLNSAAKLVRAFAGVAAAICILPVFDWRSGAQAAETRRIGISVPLSGKAAILGKHFLDGANLALEALAPAGIEIVTADDGCDKESAELAAAELKAANPGIVTGMLCNEAAYALARAFRESTVPVLVAGAQSAQILKDRQREGWKIWRLSPADADAAAAAAAALSKRWTTTPWAVVDDGTATGRALADEFRALMELAGLPPQFSDNFRPAQTNQSGLIRRLQRAGVLAAFIASDAEDAAIIAANAKDSATPLEIAGGPALAELAWSEGRADLPDGLLAAIAQDPSLAPAAATLKALLDERGIDPEPNVFTGYAAMEIAIASLAGTPASTAAALNGGLFSTVLGPVRFNADGSSARAAFEMRVWRSGTFVPLASGQD